MSDVQPVSGRGLEIAAADAVESQRANLHDSSLYLNRELASLDFQRRVLREATDPRNPILERVKFLSIVGNNLDEFLMVRVGGLMMQQAEGVAQRSPDGRTVAEQLAAIRKSAIGLMNEATGCWNSSLLSELDRAGIHILGYDQLEIKQRESIEAYFREVIFPVLTPLAFDIGHPFPHISNLSLNLAIILGNSAGEGDNFARIKVPASLPRLIPIKRSSGGRRKDGTVPHHHFFVWIEQVIAANLAALFPGMTVKQVHPFRVVRNADMIIQEIEAGDLLETMEESVRQRRFGAVVHLAINPEMPKALVDILVTNLAMDPRDVYAMEGPLGIDQLVELARVDRYDLKDRKFIPPLPPPIRFEPRPTDYFDLLKRTDLLIHHPYQSFVPVEEFLRQAARDKDVLAIKQTLYRVGANSPIVECLLEARRDYGKQVAVLVELKARFDEESNIGWARKLEEEGVHVTYGFLGLKTHSKIAMVVRKEEAGIRRYVHIGTGNYNSTTATIYEDLGILSSDEAISADATDLFNYLTGYSEKRDYRKLLVAPINLRECLERLIAEEIACAKKGAEAHIIFKVNSLVDSTVIRLLYEASIAGVKIDLIVRGICCLRPGLAGISENIRVLSIVGRFLEHSRIYYFQNGGSPVVYLGSADLMPRNLNARVEILVPVENLELIRYIRSQVLSPYWLANVRGWKMGPSGEYKYQPGDFDVQESLLMLNSSN